MLILFLVVMIYLMYIQDQWWSSGNGVYEVTAIGQATEIGKIGKAIESVEEQPTKLRVRWVPWLSGSQ